MERLHKDRLGKFGEDLAARFLIAKGYRILARNEKISYQEIDIIADFKGKTRFIEVKTRCFPYNYGSAIEAMSGKKIRNMKKAAQYYLFAHYLPYEQVGFDFIAIDIDIQSKLAKIKYYFDII